MRFCKKVVRIRRSVAHSASEWELGRESMRGNAICCNVRTGVKFAQMRQVGLLEVKI